MRVITLIIGIVLSSNIFCQTFELRQPDTTKLILIEDVLDYSESLGYLYLKEYYRVTSTKDSVEIYDWDPDGGICAFQQAFEFGIHYKLRQCKEAGGIAETITFPKTETTEIKKFIELLFYDDSNKWTDEYKYEPDGAGCYYEVIQNATSTTIEIYCGC